MAGLARWDVRIGLVQRSRWDENRESMKAKLLLVDDSAPQGSLIKGTLERLGYEVLWATSGIEGLKLARTESPDLVLLDVVMEGMDGFAVCRWLRVQSATRDIPVIMLTVKSDIHDRVEGLHIGADDYLPKPFADEELEARIFAALRVKAIQAELKQKNLQLESMLHDVEALAMTDPLTGLYNRRRFRDILHREFAVTRRYKNSLVCMMVDLDHFKSINDRFGHDAGDEVLKAVAQGLSQNLREVDVSARYGGEEFIVLLPHTPKESSRLVADRVTKVIRGLRFSFADEHFGVTASFGIAATSDVTSSDPEDLVRAADVALYDAKRRGRNLVSLYEPGMSDPPRVK
jgi:two-component system, cell cycle response regulator